MSENRVASNRIDTDFIISCAVFIQSPLIILQHVLIDVLGMSPDSTTSYRVVLTAVPMLLAIFLSMHRKPRLFIISYSVTAILLLATMVFFPQNTPYVFSEGSRFLLPVVLPSALCLASVYKLDSAEKALITMSWIAALLALVYMIAYLSGHSVFDSYNMSFSYGCLLPMIALYYKKKPLSIAVSLILLLTVIAIGSRGAAIVFAVYILADAFISRSRSALLVIVAVLCTLFILPSFSSWLSNFGISSRTISLYSEGELLSYDAGRGEIYKAFSFDSVEHPLIGIGLYGDRYYTGGGYCHNVLLEICIDFGFVVGPLLMLFLLFCFAHLYFNVSMDKKRLLLKYLCFGLMPLMASGSYLQSPYLSVLIGMSCLINNKRRYSYNEISNG